VVIENDVWIGPNATILKSPWGWRLRGGWRAGQDVPPRARIIGNPAQIRECSTALCTHTPMSWYPGQFRRTWFLTRAYVETTFIFIVPQQEVPVGGWLRCISYKSNLRRWSARASLSVCALLNGGSSVTPR